MRGSAKRFAVLKDKGELQTPVMAGVFSGPTLSNFGTAHSAHLKAPSISYCHGYNHCLGQIHWQLKTRCRGPAAYGQHVQLQQTSRRNKTWDAIHEFEQATKVNPETIEGYIVLSHLYDTQGKRNADSSQTGPL